MAGKNHTPGSESRITRLLTPPDDEWGPLTQRQQAAQTLASILRDYVRDGGWRSEPQQRKALYCWSALTGRDDW